MQRFDIFDKRMFVIMSLLRRLNSSELIFHSFHFANVKDKEAAVFDEFVKIFNFSVEAGLVHLFCSLDNSLAPPTHYWRPLLYLFVSIGSYQKEVMGGSEN